MSSVMIVEDDKDLLNLYRIALSKKGREIATLSEGTSALDMLQNPTFNPDVIFMDINMTTGISGFALMNWIRQDPRLNGVPVVVMTANDLYRDSALKAGARVFLTKPVRIAEIAALANNLGG